MSEIKLPRRDSLPCWYELSWKADIPALVLRIHEDVITNLPVVVTLESPAVKYYQKSLRLTSFVVDFNKNCGFENAFVNQRKRDGFVEVLIKLPQTKWKTDQPCEECTGTGENPFIDGDVCLWCKGDGKKRATSYTPLNAISASLNIAFTIMSLYREESSSKLPQLMTIALCSEKEMHGAALGGDFTPLFCQWLKTMEEDQEVCLLAIEAMKIAYSRMWGIEGFNEYNFRADLKSGGGLCMSCPGDACGIHPPNWHDVTNDDTGYEFSSHNTDAFLQQITLLCGLACLHDLARKSGV